MTLLSGIEDGRSSNKLNGERRPYRVAEHHGRIVGGKLDIDREDIGLSTSRTSLVGCMCWVSERVKTGETNSHTEKLTGA